jgi:hypothetical protein
VLGVPASPGALGWALILVGLLAAVGALVVLRGRLRSATPVVAAAGICLVFTAGALPYVAWRFAEDLRVTYRLHGYDAAAAGPVQAYLPGYLADGARQYVPRGATFATAVGPHIPWSQARAAFPALVMQTLFPRVSVADPHRADYVVTWGIRPDQVASVSHVWLARPKAGAYDAVYVGKVQH